MKVAIIPARGGSKRIPKKNIRFFCGKPMIAWSIAAAKESGCFDQVLVSTDDADIADLAQELGADIPFVRPAELADDFTGTNAVTAHAIRTLQQNGAVIEAACCIYATAPFLTAQVIRDGEQLLNQHQDAAFVVTVTEFEFPIQRAVTLDAQGRLVLREPQHLTTRSQDLPACYHDAGQLYWGRPKAFLDDLPVFAPHTLPLVLPKHRVQDIDTPGDWQRAELMFKAQEHQ